MRPNTRVIKFESNFRNYVYEARLSKLTGKLFGVFAGCREWANFHEANRHYDGVLGHNRFHDKWTDKDINAYLAAGNYGRWAERQEARIILRKLEAVTAMIQLRIKIKRRRK